jgi:uncharacterized membrane protein
VLGSLSELTVSTNTVKMPGGTKTHVKVWMGQGNNEAFLDFVMQVGGLIKRLGYWTAISEADEVFAAAKQALTDAEAALKAARKEESKTRTNANASDAEKADVLERNTAAAKTLDAAKLQVEEAEEECAKAVEKPFEFYGSNLSQSEQSSLEKIITKLTPPLTLPTPISSERSMKKPEARPDRHSTIACRCICSPSLSSMPRSCRSSTFSAVSRSLRGSRFVSFTTASTFSMTQLSGFP